MVGTEHELKLKCVVSTKIPIGIPLKRGTLGDKPDESLGTNQMKAWGRLLEAKGSVSHSHLTWILGFPSTHVRLLRQTVTDYRPGPRTKKYGGSPYISMIFVRLHSKTVWQMAFFYMRLEYEPELKCAAGFKNTLTFPKQVKAWGDGLLRPKGVSVSITWHRPVCVLRNTSVLCIYWSAIALNNSKHVVMDQFHYYQKRYDRLVHRRILKLRITL